MITPERLLTNPFGSQRVRIRAGIYRRLLLRVARYMTVRDEDAMPDEALRADGRSDSKRGNREAAMRPQRVR